MKISDMNNEQAATAILRLSVPFGNICDDEEMIGLIKKYQEMSNDSPVIKVVGKVLPELAMYAFKTHRNDLFEIVGALTNQTQAQVAKMNFVTTIKILRDSYDEVLKDFFTSSKKRIVETAGESKPE